jgi:ribosome biogenesis GTPase
VVEEGPGIHRVAAADGEYLARVAGRWRRVGGPEPTTGDWAAIEARPAERQATVVRVLERRSAVVRKAAGRGLAAQVLAANLDVVFVMTSLNRDLNLRRLERYLALAWESGAQPVVLLTKADLAESPAEAAAIAAEVELRAPGVPVHGLSARWVSSIGVVRDLLAPGRTGAFIGSSGVGKSTLVNALLGSHRLAVRDIREGDDRGRHTTTSRQLFTLPGGGVVIDTPGLREIQLWDAASGLDRAFRDLAELATHCRFRDCRHQGEPGCAVTAAVAAGDLSAERVAHHQKLERELRHLAARSDPHAERDAKQRAKSLCKAQKRMYSERDR